MKSSIVFLGFFILVSLRCQPVRTQTQKAFDQKIIITNLTELLGDFYVFPERGQAMADSLTAYTAQGKYDKLESVAEFAEQLTNDLRAIVDDKHLAIHPQPKHPPATTEDQAAPQRDDRFENAGIQEVKIMENNIGYLRIDAFAGGNPETRRLYEKAMTKLSPSKAIIIDLRENQGGMPESVQLLCSYFFPQDSIILLNSLYHRPSGKTNHFYTLEEVDGPIMPHKPLYILTSNLTFSAAEEFCYNLQSRKRAIIIGEPTGGGGHIVNRFELAPGIVAFIPVGRAINPITQDNWEGKGVQPDHAVEQKDALEMALQLIQLQ